ncbi:hypothetical protein [Simkania sp.]|uniref:hypothetical protein n=1 Tax=Simkania sp. TaxID=34094 RepID=UPI003B51EB90
MDSKKKTLLKLLDVIADQQKELSECHDYYQRLEKELDHRREHLANPEDLSDLTRDIATLNREFEQKTEHMHENLNEALVKGHDLAQEIGKEIAHDFKQLWDYMTDTMHQEVKLEKVLKEIERIKSDFLA